MLHWRIASGAVRNYTAECQLNFLRQKAAEKVAAILTTEADYRQYNPLSAEIAAEKELPLAAS